MSHEFEDALAGFMAWVVVIVVPLMAVALFWMVHILPEKYAHKRNHPQAEAIGKLCLMSLLFGGLLWPFAFVWAFTKPWTLRVHTVPGDAPPAGPSDGHGAHDAVGG